VLASAVIGTGPVLAASSNLSGAVTQSYNADSSVLPGMIVELKAKSPSTVIPLTSSDIRSMAGVVVPTSDAAIVLTPQTASSQQVLVASSGRYSLLVSNQNGPVKSGDYLTISSLAGIGMEAGVDQSQVIGRAAASFDGSNNVIGKVSVKNGSSGSKTVAIGHIPVDVKLAPNPLFQKNSTGVSGLLNRVANNASDQPARTAKVGVAGVVLIGTFFVTGSIVYGGVRNGMISIGRNPLAEKSIGRNLVRDIIAGLVAFALGVFVAYLILNL